jgi:hypothetical protein
MKIGRWIFSFLCWPKTNEILTFISWNSQVEIYLNDKGQLCFNNQESSSTITPNEYFRLFISADEKSVEYSHKNLSSKQFLESRIACEHGLRMIYARSTLLNMLQVWLNDDSTIFPLDKFDDYIH